MGLPAGVPAMGALAASSAGALLLGRLVVGGSPHALGSSRGRLALHAAVGLVGAVFWAWAVWSHVDLGAVSFGTVLLASLHGCRAALGTNRGGLRRVRCHKRLMPLSCGLVAANYLLGIALVRSPWTLCLYFAVAAAWWSMAGLAAYHLSAGLVEDLEGHRQSEEGQVLGAGAEGGS
ncbi:unnamed protein product [Prorocentrum cordatum]|uniref:Uncharacterized protein n=1 Tax=Prorocentrum cordatum TaxID=2364126 RepID=A0ABN9TJZ6_9DINO|nr:unnamed protein product [Polarella glacialis]